MTSKTPFRKITWGLILSGNLTMEHRALTCTPMPGAPVPGPDLGLPSSAGTWRSQQSSPTCNGHCSSHVESIVWLLTADTPNIRRWDAFKHCILVCRHSVLLLLLSSAPVYFQSIMIQQHRQLKQQQLFFRIQLRKYLDIYFGGKTYIWAAIHFSWCPTIPNLTSWTSPSSQ